MNVNKRTKKLLYFFFAGIVIYFLITLSLDIAGVENPNLIANLLEKIFN